MTQNMKSIELNSKKDRRWRKRFAKLVARNEAKLKKSLESLEKESNYEKTKREVYFFVCFGFLVLSTGALSVAFTEPVFNEICEEISKKLGSSQSLFSDENAAQLSWLISFTWLMTFFILIPNFLRNYFNPEWKKIVKLTGKNFFVWHSSSIAFIFFSIPSFFYFLVWFLRKK
jgi:hypothetical protein